MTRLKSIENDQVELEVIECDCGFHLGIDATFLDQVGDCEIVCPSCGRTIRTAAVCPEDMTPEQMKQYRKEGRVRMS